MYPFPPSASRVPVATPGYPPFHANVLHQLGDATTARPAAYRITSPPPPLNQLRDIITASATVIAAASEQPGGRPTITAQKNVSSSARAEGIISSGSFGVLSMRDINLATTTSRWTTCIRPPSGTGANATYATLQLQHRQSLTKSKPSTGRPAPRADEQQSRYERKANARPAVPTRPLAHTASSNAASADNRTVTSSPAPSEVPCLHPAHAIQAQTLAFGQQGGLLVHKTPESAGSVADAAVCGPAQASASRPPVPGVLKRTYTPATREEPMAPGMRGNAWPGEAYTQQLNIAVQHHPKRYRDSLGGTASV